MNGKSCSNNKVIGLISGNGTGKTSLAECLLYNSKATDRLGTIETKNTVSDFSPLETRKGFSVSSSILNYKWKDFNINLIDCPGYMDFIGQTQAAIKVIDSALLVVDTKSGVQAPTELVIELLAKNPKPMFCILNKLDLENIDYIKVVEDIKSEYKLKLVPITIPLNSGENFSKIVDILQNQAYEYKEKNFTGNKTSVDENIKGQIESHHNELIESIVETDDELLNKYLEGEKIDNKVISEVFKKAVTSGKVIPVFAISSGKNFGIDILMDYINSLLPSALDITPIKTKDLNKDSEVEIKSSPDGPVLAYVFKTMADPYIGKLSIFRIFTGTIKINESYHLSSSGKTYKFTNLFKLQGKNQSDVSEASCGDIVAVSKIMDISNDDTISSQDQPLKIPETEYFPPTLPKAVIPRSKGDEEKISNGLSKLIQEDPTIRQELNLEVHQNILWGMGELHLSMAREKLKEKFDIGIDILTPDVAYKETIRKDAKAEYKYKKQSGGRGQYGHVLIEIKPLGSGGGFEFKNSIFGGAIPKSYVPGVEKGIREALLKGVLAEYPVVDVSVNLYDGSYHTVDSSEMAFKIAASMAFKKGMQEASPVILEPIIELEIIAPEKYMGDIIGDINAKRGKIISMTQIENKKQLIKATAPQSETFNYAIDLTSLTQGRGRFIQKFSHYEELPPNLAHKIIDERKKQKE
ncbi:MAG: elongation factor G [Candidatus Hydromicrobium americanum]|nr:MAG: elongation factor G [Candidatus Hydromicrobium americanum]